MLLIFRRNISRVNGALGRVFSTSTNSPVEEEERKKTTTKTHFGFQTVEENEKSQKVYDVFENVANTYDLMNDVMSFGIHRVWKDLFVQRLNPPSSSSTAASRFLDVAGGTGDIAFRILRHIRYKKEKTERPPEMEDADVPNSSSITICDINESMLEVGIKRAGDLGFAGKDLTWVKGDAESLPFRDAEFDAYTIAFGIRNCTHVDKVLQEANRVLKPGGRFMCLEFSRVSPSPIRSIYDWYSFQIIPVMGQLFAGDWNSYQYLVESIRQFPDQEEFCDMIRQAGFRFVTFENLSCGVVSIHSGFKKL